MNIAIDVTPLAALPDQNVKALFCKQLVALIDSDADNAYFVLNLYNDVSFLGETKHGKNVEEFFFYTGDNASLWQYPELIGAIYQNFICQHKIELLITAIHHPEFYPLNGDWFSATRHIVNRGDLPIAELIAKAVLETPLPAQSTPEEASAKARIAMFTPLPPLQSGISDYSYDIILQMAQYVDIDVFIDSGYTHSCDFPDNVNVYVHTQYEPLWSHYCTTVFHVGNSEFHLYMFDYLRKYRGIIVLHDYNLHGLGASHFFKDNGQKIYKDILLCDYDETEAEWILQQVRNGNYAVIEKYPVNGYVTQYAHTFIVHSEWMKKQLLLKNIEANIYHIPLYATLPDYPLADRKKVQAAAREKLGINSDAVCVSAFGIISKAKRTLPILDALNRLMNEFPHLKMLFVGKLTEDIEKYFESYLIDHNLEDRIEATGYTSLEDFLLYIDAVDICLSLRYPTNGESSGSLARLLARGKSVIITDIGSFSEIPDACCLKLQSPENMPPEEEEEEIYAAIQSLLVKPDQRAKMEENARQYVEQELDIRKIGVMYRKVVTKPVRKSILTHKRLKRIMGNVTQANAYEMARTLAYAMQEFASVV